MRGNQPRNNYGQFVTVTRIKVTCPMCGKEHTKYPSEVKRNERFCSVECWGIFWSINHRGEKHHRYKRQKVICAECGKEFETIPSQQTRYCSHHCANLNTPHYSGEDNPNWRGGLTSLICKLRTSKRYQEWRKAVFARDYYKCQDCGTRHKFLHAHHIVPLSEDLTKALDLNNGLTLCIDCHQERHPELRLSVRGDKKSALW